MDLCVPQVPPNELLVRVEKAFKVAEQRAREQFHSKEDAWEALSRRLYILSMEEIQMDETFNRLLLKEHGVDSLVRHLFPGALQHVSCCGGLKRKELGSW